MKSKLKCLWGIMVLLCLCRTTYGQETPSFTKFFITINDANYRPTVTPVASDEGVTVFFNKPLLDEITARYSFRQFHPAFPNSTQEELQNVYLIEASSGQYMNDLVAFNNTVFTDQNIATFSKFYVTITDPAYVPTFETSNHESTLTFDEPELNEIAADYSFTGFELAFPNSDDPAQANIYVVVCSSETMQLSNIKLFIVYL